MSAALAPVTSSVEPTAEQKLLSAIAQYTDAAELLNSGAPRFGGLARDSRALFDLLAGAVCKRYCVLVQNARAITLKDVVALMGGRPSLPGLERRTSVAASLTHYGVAQQIVDASNGDLRYQIDHEKWFKWSGDRWQLMLPAQLQSLALTAVKGLANGAAGIRDSERQAKFLDRLEQLYSDANRRGIVSTLGAISETHIRWVELNQHSRFLTCGNGAVDLLSGELARDRELLLTVQNNTNYDPQAPCPRFMKAVSDTFEGRPEDIQYYELLMGYTTMGRPSERVMPFHIGKGVNGKTLLINAIVGALGEHAATSSYHLIASEQGASSNGDANGPSPALRRLLWTRLAFIEELPKGGVLRDAAVKQYAGGGRVAARGLHEELIEFDITFTLHVACNDLVAIRGGQESTWRRIYPVVYTRQFTDGEDPNLAHELTKEREGIVAWLVRCAQKYQAWSSSGKTLRDAMPARATAELNRLKRDQDPLADWLEDCCEMGPGLTATGQALWNSYSGYCLATGTSSRSVQGQRGLVARLREDARFVATENAYTNKVRGRGFRGLKVRGDTPWAEQVEMSA